MSTYAVFGMHRDRAVEMARRSVKTVVKDEQGEWQGLSASEWEVLVQAEADKTMESQRIIQLSQKFDAPDFARDFLAIAKRDGARRLHIKSYAKTGERNPKTGRPIMQWSEVI